MVEVQLWIPETIHTCAFGKSQLYEHLSWMEWHSWPVFLKTKDFFLFEFAVRKSDSVDLKNKTHEHSPRARIRCESMFFLFLFQGVLHSTKHAGHRETLRTGSCDPLLEYCIRLVGFYPLHSSSCRYCTESEEDNACYSFAEAHVDEGSCTVSCGAADGSTRQRCGRLGVATVLLSVDKRVAAEAHGQALYATLVAPPLDTLRRFAELYATYGWGRGWQRRPLELACE